ncbi:MAG: hypothetical protein ACRDGM_15970 [bacterium]
MDQRADLVGSPDVFREENYAADAAFTDETLDSGSNFRAIEINDEMPAGEIVINHYLTRHQAKFPRPRPSSASVHRRPASLPALVVATFKEYESPFTIHNSLLAVLRVGL